MHTHITQSHRFPTTDMKYPLTPPPRAHTHNIVFTHMDPLTSRRHMATGRSWIQYIQSQKNIKLAIRLPCLQDIYILSGINGHSPHLPNNKWRLHNQTRTYLHRLPLQSICVIKNQIKHPTLHNNHLNETILKETLNFLIQITQPTTLYKVKTHANIKGNKEAKTLAKKGTSK